MSKRTQKPKDTFVRLPHWTMATSEIQNQLGCSYVRAVVYHAGCMVQEHHITDIGVDFTIRYVNPWGESSYVLGKTLDIQLKSSYAATELDECVKYNLEQDEYDKLRREDAETPQILVVLAMPRDSSLWLETSAKELTLRRCAYWFDMRSCKPKKGKPLVVIPKAQPFNASAIQGPIRDLVETWKQQ